MSDAILTCILLNIPTTTLTLYVSLAVQHCYVSLRKLLISGLLLGILVTIYRNLPIPFGLHIPLFIMTLIFAVKNLSNNTWGMSCLYSMAAYLITAVGEYLTASILIALGMPIKEIVKSTWLIIMAGWLSNIFLVAFAVALSIRHAKVSVRQ